jgi:hypothetical protein
VTTPYSTAKQLYFNSRLLYCFLRCGREALTSEIRNGQHELGRTNLNVRNVLPTALTVKGTVLYDITPCSLVNIY